LRILLVLGVHAALYRMTSGKMQSPLADGARLVLANKPFKLVAVALANEMAHRLGYHGQRDKRQPWFSGTPP
jgi:transposase